MKIRLADGSGTIDLKYLVEDVDRYGKTRLYFRRKGRLKIRIESPIGTDAFLQEYREALAGKPKIAPLGSSRGASAPTGSLRALVERYVETCGEFRRLDERTQYVRRGILETICLERISEDDSRLVGSLPYNQITVGAIRALRDRKAADAPEQGNAWIKALRQLFAYAKDIELMDRNPARDVPYIKTGSSGFHTWTVEEVRQFETRHALGTKARLALALLLYLGPRRTDVTLLGRQHVREAHNIAPRLRAIHPGRWLRYTQHKNRNRKPVTLEIPILPELEAVISASPCGDLTFLTTAFGKPFTSAGFGNWFRDRCVEAGVPGRAHGLRKAGATIAAENGASAHQLMAVFGWTTLRQAELYTRAAQQKLLAASGMALIVPGRDENESVQQSGEVRGSWTKSEGK
jgi:site-specific recombinase XerD